MSWYNHHYTKQADSRDVRPEDIDDMFESWGGHREVTDGFIEWAWDVRKDTLQELEHRDFDSLVSEIVYSLRQQAQFRNVDKGQASLAANRWVLDNSDVLQEALQQSLREDRRASVADQLLKLGSQRKDLRKHIRPILDAVSVEASGFADDHLLHHEDAAVNTIQEIKSMFERGLARQRGVEVVDHQPNRLSVMTDKSKTHHQTLDFEADAVHVSVQMMPSMQTTRGEELAYFEGVPSATELEKVMATFDRKIGSDRQSFSRPQLQKASVVDTGYANFNSRRQPKKGDAEAQRVLSAINAAERENHVDSMMDAFMTVYGTDSHEVTLRILLDESDKFRQEFHVSVMSRVNSM